MERYKSWSGLRKQLEESLCDALRGRVTYFLSGYHKVHNSYRRAAIRCDGAELVVFSWIEVSQQEQDIAEEMKKRRVSFEELGGDAFFKERWDAACRWCEMDFLAAALRFRDMAIVDALASEDLIVRSLAIMDRRVGRRTLERLAEEGAYAGLPDWARQFYDLRIAAEKLTRE